MDPQQLRAILSLKESIRDCTQCPLSSSTTPVPHSGILNHEAASYAIVGEAPGPEEAKQGKPFVGPSGKFLRAELKVVEKETHCPTGNTVFLNTVNCWPKGNGTAVRPPTAPEREACKPWLTKQLELLRPDFVLVLGGTALNYWWSGRKITESRGKWWTHQWPSTDNGGLASVIPKQPALFISTYHPSAVIRERGSNRMLLTFKHDLKCFYEVGLTMWTARRFGVEQQVGAELEWADQTGSGRNGPSVGRRRRPGPDDIRAAYDGSLFAEED